MKLCSDILFSLTKVLLVVVGFSVPVSWASDPASNEASRVLDKVMALPTISVAEGFTASTFIGTGHFYDPLFMRDGLMRDGHAGGQGAGENSERILVNRILVNDDGGAVGDKGSRIFSFDAEGNIAIKVDIDKLPPVVGFDIAPAGFAGVAGQFVVLSQEKSGFDSALENHLVQAIPQDGKGEVTRLCTLQALPKKQGGIKAGFGADGRFGPEGSPFAGRFFSAMLKNATVYETTADGKCKPFVSFDPETWGLPFALNFTQDHQHMLVSVGPGIGAGMKAPQGGIARVNAQGDIVGDIIAPGIGRASGMAYAPENFGGFGGQLFVAAIGDFEIPVPMTQALQRDGKVYRIDDAGLVHLVASGFINPTGIHFAFGKLLVADINGDFIAGRRELPDGFIMAIGAQ